MLIQIFEGSKLLAFLTHACSDDKVCLTITGTSGFLNSGSAQLLTPTAHKESPPLRHAFPVTFRAGGNVGKRKAPACALIGRALRSAPPPVFRSPAQQKPSGSSSSLTLVDAEPLCSWDAAWKPKPHLPHGPAVQPGTSDESCAQTSASSSAASSSSTICCWLTCCCTPAARSDGPDGNYCSWCSCGLCCRSHARSCHHWRLQWK